MSNNNTPQGTIMEFPCAFAIKTMGLANTGFDRVALDIVCRHSPDVSNDNVQTKLSKTGKYVSVTISMTAQSKQQMDAIYQDLTDCEHVLMSL